MSWQRQNIGSRVNREVHARFWERLGVKLVRATRQPLRAASRAHLRRAVPRQARLFEFATLMDRMDAARASSLTAPERFFKKAQKKINNGHYDFGVDAASSAPAKPAP
jgi:hypothetical protein